MKLITSIYKGPIIYLAQNVNLNDIDRQLTPDDFKSSTSPTVCVILYLYSMEPPFYEALNKACRSARPFRQQDLKNFGPFACAMNQILFGGHLEKSRERRIETGCDRPFNKEIGLFSRCFFLYRGVSMIDEWIDEWKFKTSSFDDKGIRNYKFIRLCNGG